MDKSMKKVSVVVPNYNYAKYISKRIDSILRQTYPIYELIILDDCSTDNSWNILEEYSKKDCRIKIFKLAKNSKQGAARNKGLDVARGKYVTFVDSDDFLALNFIEKIYNALETNNCDIAVCNIKKEKQEH